MRKHSILLVLIIIFLFFEKSNAQHFSDDGFYDGISRSEAKKLINAMRLGKFGVSHADSDKYIVGTRQINGNLFVYEFHFCQSKLIRYRKDILPSISNLILVLDKLTSKYGNKLKTYTNISMGVTGEQRKLSFLWKTTLYRVEITYDIFTSNESLTIWYSVPDKCSK